MMNSYSSYMSNALIGVGTSACWKIHLDPLFEEYKFDFYGSEQMIGTVRAIESLISSIDEGPGIMYACFPLMIDLILFKDWGE